MMAAAAAWNNLGAELATAASSYQSVIAALTGEQWLGPASAAMTAAAAPYVGWMNTTAAAAEQAATQAMASAAAYQAAFAMTVPPPVIAANRAQLAMLVATNFLGQNTPAIAANEALYTEMWAQDAAAMYGYAGSSATAGLLQPLNAPAQITNPAAAAGQSAAVSTAGTQSGLSQLVSTLPSTVQGLASPLAAGDASGALQGVIAQAGNIGAWNMFAGISSGVGLANAHSAEMAAADAMAEAVLPTAVAPAAPAAAVGATNFGAAPVVAAGMGQASSVGGLSVPASWSGATPTSTPAITLAGSGWTAAADESTSMAAVPAGMPVGAGGRGFGLGFGAPRYGFKPTVMPKSVVV